MATTVNISSNYAGQIAAGYIAPLILQANTIEKGLVTVHDNVKYKLNVANLDVAPAFINTACSMSPGGTVTRFERVLELKDISALIEVCKRDYITSWEAEQERGNLTGRAVNPDFAGWLVERLAAHVQKKVEQTIWSGTNATGSTVGLGSRFETSSDVVKRAGSAVTAQNVLSEIAATLALVPDEVYDADDFRIIITQKVARAYQEALGYGQVSGSVFTNSYQNLLTVGEKPLNFQGVPMEVANGLTSLNANAIVIARAADLHIGTNLTSDWTQNNILVVDKTESDAGNRNVQMAIDFSLATQITNDEQIVYSRTVSS